MNTIYLANFRQRTRNQILYRLGLGLRLGLIVGFGVLICIQIGYNGSLDSHTGIFTVLLDTLGSSFSTLLFPDGIMIRLGFILIFPISIGIGGLSHEFDIGYGSSSGIVDMMQCGQGNIGIGNYTIIDNVIGYILFHIGGDIESGNNLSGIECQSGLADILFRPAIGDTCITHRSMDENSF